MKFHSTTESKTARVAPHQDTNKITFASIKQLVEEAESIGMPDDAEVLVYLKNVNYDGPAYLNFIDITWNKRDDLIGRK